MTTLTIMKEMSMGYKAKCKYCGKSIDTNSAYKIVVGKTNRYYCNEEEYNIIHKAQQIKDDTYNLIYEIFGRKITNTILYKEINELFIDIAHSRFVTDLKIDGDENDLKSGVEFFKKCIYYLEKVEVI